MNFRIRTIPRALFALILVMGLLITSCGGSHQSQAPVVDFEQPSAAVSYQHKCEGFNAAPCTPQEYIKESYNIGSSLIEKLNSGSGDTRQLVSQYYRTYSLQNLVVMQLARSNAQGLAGLESFLLPELPPELLAYTSSEIYNVPKVQFQGGFGDPFAQYSVNGSYFTPVTLGQAQHDFNTAVAVEIIDELGDAFEASLRNQRHSYRGRGITNYSPTTVTVRNTNQYIQVTNVPATTPNTPPAATQTTNRRLRTVVVRPAPVTPPSTATPTPTPSAPLSASPRAQPSASATPKPNIVVTPSQQSPVPRVSQSQTTATQVKPSAVQFGSTDRQRNTGSSTSIRQSSHSRPAVSSSRSTSSGSRRR